MSVQFLWPFDELMIRFHEMVIGASRHAMFAERTGISERRWRDPTKQFRPTTVMKAMNHARERILDDLRKRGFDEVERAARFEQMPRSLTGQFIFCSEILGELEYPNTRSFALKIDALGREFTEARLDNDLPRAKKLLQTTIWLDQSYFSGNGDELRATRRPELLADFEAADSWSSLHRPVGGVTVNLLFSLLALWEIESNQRLFQPFQKRSVFSFLFPRARIEEEGPLCTKRDVFEYPIRRLIDLSAALAHRHHEQAWPAKALTVKELKLICFRESERTFVDWRDGTKRLLWSDFERIGRYLFYRGDDIEGGGSVPLLTPLFCAATLFQMLLVERDSTSRTRSITIPSAEYSYWYERHALEQQASGVTFGDTPWPAWFTDP